MDLTQLCLIVTLLPVWTVPRKNCYTCTVIVLPRKNAMWTSLDLDKIISITPLQLKASFDQTRGKRLPRDLMMVERAKERRWSWLYGID